MFDRSGEPFIRYSVDMLSRRDCFKLLDVCGIKAVTHGLVKDLLPYYARRTFLIYLNEKLHATEGKLLVNADKDSYYSNYASIVEGIPALSYRVLNIGNRQWKLEYKSDDVFFSNKGNVEISLIAELKEKEQYPRPLHGRNFWAIDFVKSNSELKACDFNTAPAIQGTPIEKLLSATEIVDLIKYY